MSIKSGRNSFMQMTVITMPVRGDVRMTSCFAAQGMIVMVICLALALQPSRAWAQASSGDAPETVAPNNMTDAKAPELQPIPRSLKISGDVEFLKNITLLDLLNDYIDGISEGIDLLINDSGKMVTTKTERMRAAPEKLRKALQIVASPAERSQYSKMSERSLYREAQRYSLYDFIKKDIDGVALTQVSVAQILARYRRILARGRYYFASIDLLPESPPGEVHLKVDKGRIGDISYLDYSSRNKEYVGRYFSRRQIESKFGNFRHGAIYDHAALHETIYAINAHPDLRLDALVKPGKGEGPGNRYADIVIFVGESRPIHGSLSVENSGTKRTGEWRPSLILQHLNLTKSDDVLTAHVGPISSDMDTLLAFGASYYRPFSMGRGGATLYGGYSQLSAGDVVQGISIEGQGWYVGCQGSYAIRSSRQSITHLGVSLTYRDIEDQLILLSEEGEDSFPLDPRPLKIVPVSLLLSHASLQSDRFGGRNDFTLQWVLHFDGMPGASEPEAFEAARPGATPDYYVVRVQAARRQPIWGRKQEIPIGLPGDEKDLAGKERKDITYTDQWLFFLRVAGQWASDILAPVEEQAIGGADTVRGFPERVLMGDHGLVGTAEFRTPMLSAKGLVNWLSKSSKSTHAAPASNTFYQFLLFADGGWVKDLAAAEEATDSWTIASVGAGVRLQVGRFAQLRFDWGFPISGRDKVNELVTDDAEQVETSGRFHLGAQIQF